MVNYKCPRCGYENNIKTKYINHLKRKTICDPILSNCKLKEEYIKYNIIEKIDIYKLSSKMSSKCNIASSLCSQNVTKSKYICSFCNKNLSSRQGLWRHLKTCKEKKNDDTVKESMTELANLLNEKERQLKEQDKDKHRQLEEELDKRDKQINEQNKQIQELIKKAGIITTTNNIQNNFKLLNYKETDTSHLTENDYVKCLEHYNFCVPHLIRKIHFNPKKPENHNIYISNLKNSYVMIYMNNKWKVKNRDETISRVIDDKQIILEKKIQEWVESGIQYPKVMARFSRYIEKREEDDVINAIKEDIKLMLYNNRNMIIENNKKLLK